MSSERRRGWAIGVHGGAGRIERHLLKPEQERAYREALDAVVRAGAGVLDQGGSAVDAVEVSVRMLEEDPLFNAGRGAAFTADGRNELDAAIMDGATLQAGAVAGVRRVRSPIGLAREVMTASPHVMLIGEGAEAFAERQGVELVDPSWFFTERRWRSLERFLAAEGSPPPERPPAPADGGSRAALAHDEGKHGTVGVVALDREGRVAAGTSTGGVTGKRFGRVGDSPIVGAGVYASDQGCAVSATGAGEYFIRLTVARDVSALMEFAGLGLQAAADRVVKERLTELGGEGGVIAVAPDGQVAWSFNTTGMYRARASEGGVLQVCVFGDEG